MANQKLSPIAKLNDEFRRDPFVEGRILYSMLATGLTPINRLKLLLAVSEFNEFTLDNDPYGEHDFGKLKLFGHEWLWKIDYYADSTCEYGSEDPADLTKCFRVLTIMDASEY